MELEWVNDQHVSELEDISETLSIIREKLQLIELSNLNKIRELENLNDARWQITQISIMAEFMQKIEIADELLSEIATDADDFPRL